MADKDAKRDEEILKRARERFAYAEEVDGDNRKAAIKDAEFVYVPGAQWDQDTKAKRQKWKLPSLEFNALKQFVSQTVNDQRQGRPGVRVHPAGAEASEKVAEIKQELIRAIEVKSDAESAYDTAFQHAVVGGRGYWRVVADYESERSFNQCLKVKRVADPNSVRIDPDYQEADASDIAWGFVVEPVRKDDYERRYKDAPISWTPSEDTTLWYPSDDDQVVFVADYYEITESEEDLVLLDNGQAMWADELEQRVADGTVPAEARVIKQRKGTRKRCAWYTLGGGEQIIEEHEWRGRYVPIVVCAGDEIVIDGERHYQGLIRTAREPQQLMNYGMTQMAVRLSQTPRPPWVAAVDAVKGFEHLYDHSNEEDYAMLPYRHADAAGNPIPQPQRQPGSDIDAGWANFVQMLQGQIRSTLGLYENTIGMRGQEVSGKAILARQSQGDNATYHYIDNLRRAIQHTGRLIDDLIPHYYDTQRLVAMVERDGKQKMATINAQKAVDDPATGAVTYIRDPDNDLTRGEYAVTVEAGPSDNTKREQTRETLAGLFQAYPPAAQILGDKLIQVIDMPDAREAAERFKVMLPLAIQQMEAAKEQGRRPPDAQTIAQMQQLQGQLQQAGAMVQQLQQENAQLKQGAQAKMAEANMDAQTEEKKAILDAHTEVKKARIQVAGKILAEHLAGLRMESAAAGMPPPQVDMQGTMAGLEQVEGHVEESAQTGAPMPMPHRPQPKTGPSADTVLLVEAIGAIAKEVGSAIVMAMSQPRALQVQTDAMGNVTGGVSVPAGTLQ